jgi:hypothetical protein
MKTAVARDPLGEFLGLVLPAILRAIATDPVALDALRKLRDALSEPAPEPSKTTGLTKKEIAAALGVSSSTIDRFDRCGAPHFYCGDTRRYDLENYRAWAAGRGKRAASPREAA